jgi:hypothetical protein
VKSFSVYRRKSNFVDLYLNHRPNVASYNFKYATNFDAVFSTFDSVSINGKRSVSALDLSYQDSQFRDKTRFTFAPSDYSIDDTKNIWIRVAPVSTTGVVGPDEGITLISPTGPKPGRAIVINGSVSTSVIELNFLKQLYNPNIKNTGASSLFVSFETGGSEYQLQSGSGSNTILSSSYSTFDQLFVRSDGATTFSALLADRNELM